ncbi:conserved hypothetical protein [Paecilomyces variotii No. 5]|uniref:Uncharacterized protein n=1 Tax=Byssochlamys spectabilis (strain No. 5 / NBRC 109023) TaxID=1356009 RepID=V5FUP7_BYSSN|nr:conserved hypothetical protein [Paecilomyces variotii No. 5]
MTGFEIADVPPMTSTPERPLLKAHKALPRRRDVSQESVTPIRTPPSNRTTKPQGDTAVATVPRLPLTPPGQPGEEYNRKQSEGRDGLSRTEGQTVRVVTPPHQRHPLTPDITPPRIAALSQKTRPGIQMQASNSSRAESFKTAPEGFSDEDTRRGNLSSQSLLRMSEEDPLPEKVVGRIESGPPSESTSGKATTSTLKHSRHVGHVSSFESFDGDWVNRREAGSATSHESQARNDQRGHRPNGNLTPRKSEKGSIDAKALAASLSREKGLRDRVRETRDVPASRSIEQFGEDIGWLSTEEPAYINERVHSWRMSSASTTSTVEALVIDSPPRVKPILRHTEKRSSLRSASSPMPKSNRTSIASTADSHHRLVHKAARITNRHRWSAASDLSVPASVSSNATQQKPEVIPVVVIPQRRSSLKSSASASRNQSTIRSRGSSRRPTVAPDSRNGSLDLPRQRPRRRSESSPSSFESRDTGIRGRVSNRPKIPQRSSSLSAPTSRNTSRATSLTSESLQRHTLAMETENRKQKEEADKEVPASTNVKPDQHLSVDFSRRTSVSQAADDNSALRRPSLPYTLPSIQSSSPGPVEIHEATAVTLFPHNNKSLLLVEQNVQPESQAVQALRTFPTYVTAFGRAETPEVMPSAVLGDVDSPLRNPRPPPKPPVVKIIPPTPMAEIERKLGSPELSNGLGRRFRSVRRAFTVRRLSEVGSPFTRPISMRAAKNRKAGKEMDSRLHPFWRPRGFWDDFSDSDDEDIAHSSGDHGANDMIISNSLGMPQKRVIFDGPISLARRIHTAGRADGIGPHGSSRVSLVSGRSLGSGIFRPRSPYSSRRLRTISLFGLRLRLIGLRELQWRLRRARDERERIRLNERRERLKQRIGDRVFVNSSTSAGNIRNRGAITAM